MKRHIPFFVACMLAITASAQEDSTYVVDNAGAVDNSTVKLELQDDSTDVMSVNDIINELQDVNTRHTMEKHIDDIWARRSYLNLSYCSAQLMPQENIALGYDGRNVPDYKSSWGLSLQSGRSYRLHKKAISNMLQFNIDYTWVDLNVNHFDMEADANGKAYDSSVKNGDDYYIPWNLEKYEFNYGMNLGPSITFNPLTGMSSKDAHYLQFYMYYHFGYHVSGLYMVNEEKADLNTEENIYYEDMADNTKINWGHGTTSSFGFSVVWKFIGLGYEHRVANIKYKAISTDDFGEKTYKFKSSLNRIYIQFRL